MSKLALVFQGLSTAAIITLTALAVRRELKDGTGGALLGLPPAEHKAKIKRLEPRLGRLRLEATEALAARQCDVAIDRIVDYAAHAGASAAHAERSPDQATRAAEALLERYRRTCG